MRGHLFSRSWLFAALVLGIGATAARAEVHIASVPTRNMSCAANVCKATAIEAFLNSGDLQAMLASGSVTVESGRIAKDIVVNEQLTWSSGVTLTLEAYHSLTIAKPMSVTGAGGLSLVTNWENETGTNGVLSIGGQGRVTFASLSSPLTIDGKAFQLVDTAAGIAAAIVEAGGKGRIALANDYDAHADPVYVRSVVGPAFHGTFDGLGNTISNVRIYEKGPNNIYTTEGFFSQVSRDGSVDHFHLRNIHVTGHFYEPDRTAEHDIGGLAGEISVSPPKHPSLFEDSVGGVIDGCCDMMTKGGLVGRIDYARVSRSFADVSIRVGNSSTGGGLIGFNDHGVVLNCYATGDVRTAASDGASGGLVGNNAGSVVTSYSKGLVVGPPGATGGLFATVVSPGSATDTYWDMTTSGVTNPSQGAGSPANFPGITGLTNAQLQAGLPSGFDPTLWAEDPDINGGLPFLLDNPPRQAGGFRDPPPGA